MNEEHYPSLYHPELYLLEGGYKVFYQHHKVNHSKQTAQGLREIGPSLFGVYPWGI